MRVLQPFDLNYTYTLIKTQVHQVNNPMTLHVQHYFAGPTMRLL